MRKHEHLSIIHIYLSIRVYHPSIDAIHRPPLASPLPHTIGVCLLKAGGEPLRTREHLSIIDIYLSIRLYLIIYICDLHTPYC